MEKLKSAFTILYLLSLCDHDVSEKEIQIIKDFLQFNFPHHLSFKPKEVINQMRFLSPVGQRREFYSAALTFEKLSDIRERVDFLRSAINLIYADHDLKPQEQVLIESLAHWWNIDLPTFFETKLSQVT